MGGVAAAAVIYAIGRPRITPQLTARALRVRVGKLGIEGNRLKVALIISNPTSNNIVVRSVVGEVWLNGVKVGNVESFVETVVAANKKTTLYTDVRLMALQLFEVYREITAADNKKIRLDIAFTGTVNANNMAIPVTANNRLL